jgi:hypothetical protein
MTSSDLRDFSLLVEYWRLKEEQLTRIHARDQTLYLTLVSFGVAGYTILQHANLVTISLMMPLFTFILGWSYLSGDRKVSEIRDYCRDILAVRISPTESDEVFSWETAHRTSGSLIWSKAFQLAVDLLTFVGTAMIALSYFVVNEGFGSWRSVAIVLCVLLQATLLIEFVSHFREELRKPTTGKGTRPVPSTAKRPSASISGVPPAAN